MTFSLQLMAWLALTAAGLCGSLGSLRYAVLIVRTTERRSAHPDVVDGARHLRRTELERVVGWALFVMVGVLATLQEAPPAPVGSTPIGALIGWMLVATVALWAYKTASDYLYTRRRFHRLVS